MSTPTNSSLHELRNQVIAKGNVSGTDRYIARARGAVLTDVEGTDYLDFGGGIAVMNVGHSHPKVVAAIKNESEESPLFFAARKAYYHLIARLSDVDQLKNFTGFGLYDRVVVERLREIDDPYPYLRGIVAELGYPLARVNFVQPRRKRGFTKNNLYTLYDIAMLGFTSHTKVPLRLATMFGFAASAMFFLIGLVYLGYKLVFWDRFALGVAPVVIGLFFFGSVQLFFIGIIGEYIGAIHTKVMKRPLVVERERLNF